MRSSDFKAINVTIPYKEKVIPYLNGIDEHAKAIGAVNTVVNRGGELFGFNTDFEGMKRMLLRAGFEIKEKKVLVLGSGGTSKTARAVTDHLGAREVIVVSRTGDVNYGNVLSLHSDAEYIINTTPCGMFPDIHSKALPIDGFDCLEGVADVVYNPLRTEIVLDAEERGLKTCNGLYMLVAQAVLASGIFLSKEYPDKTVDDVFKTILDEKQNIVFTGMPGCGKTTIGKLVAEKLNMEFIDTDDLIARKSGLSPSRIITENGEDHFRDIESEIIASIAAKNHCVIATGGGSVLRNENVRNLKKNGKVIFLNRSIEDIVPTDDRPLSSSRAAIRKRYDERLPVYKRSADIEIFASGGVEEVLNRVLSVIQ